MQLSTRESKSKPLFHMREREMMMMMVMMNTGVKREKIIMMNERNNENEGDEYMTCSEVGRLTETRWRVGNPSQLVVGTLMIKVL